jgi:hypothetical protein
MGRADFDDLNPSAVALNAEKISKHLAHDNFSGIIVGFALQKA